MSCACGAPASLMSLSSSASALSLIWRTLARVSCSANRARSPALRPGADFQRDAIWRFRSATSWFRRSMTFRVFVWSASRLDASAPISAAVRRGCSTVRAWLVAPMRGFRSSGRLHERMHQALMRGRTPSATGCLSMCRGALPEDTNVCHVVSRSALSGQVTMHAKGLKVSARRQQIRGRVRPLPWRPS